VNRDRELTDILQSEPWMMSVLATAREVDLPDWYIGAGAIRDLVWDVRFGGGFDPAAIEDVDLVFFDPDDLSHEREVAVEQLLGPDWDVKNQAAVHTWFEARFGTPATPLASTVDGIATWPEYCTCIGVRLERDGAFTIAAPHGLDDLLDGVWRTNAVRVTPAESAKRLAKKEPATRWPGVRVV
jgi:uncharacterized protein